MKRLEWKGSVRALFFSFSFLFIAILMGCNNVASKLTSPSSVVSQSNPSTPQGSFVLQSVVPDPNTPNTVIDLVGTNGQFQSYCAQGTCECQYSYSQSGVGSQTITTPTTYQETNLVRCLNTVPTGVASFTVALVVVPSTTGTPSQSASVLYASNTLTVNLNGGAFAGATSYLDLSNPNSYLEAERFQCRRRPFIPNPMNTTMLDPFQSQDPRVIYAFSFYTTNVSKSLEVLQSNTDQSWECSLSSLPQPMMPNQATSGIQWWANPNVYSLAPCTSSFCQGDGFLMYPQNSLSSGNIPYSNPKATGKRRSAFYLASSSYGVFSVPVNAAAAPGTSGSTVYQQPNYGVIGYAAASVPSTNGTSSCPAITLPPNSTWVKLWNYRATNIEPVKYVSSSTSMNPSNFSIACYTTPDSGGFFPSCTNATNFYGSDLSTMASNQEFATRINLVGSSAGSSNISPCFNLSDMKSITPNAVPDPIATPSPNPGTGYCDESGGMGANCWLDTWYPSNFKYDNTVSIAVMTSLPWGMYSDLSTLFSNASSNTYPNIIVSPSVAPASTPTQLQNINYYASLGATATALPAITPSDGGIELQTTYVEANSTLYTDNLFVTTDPGVSDADMIAGASDVEQYMPLTFHSALDSLGPTPANPNTSNVTPVRWGIEIQDIASPQAGANVYPLCVLQFYD